MLPTAVEEFVGRALPSEQMAAEEGFALSAWFQPVLPERNTIERRWSPRMSALAHPSVPSCYRSQEVPKVVRAVTTEARCSWPHPPIAPEAAAPPTRRGGLDVVPRYVVDASDGRETSQGGVGPVIVVAVEPAGEQVE